MVNMSIQGPSIFNHGCSYCKEPNLAQQQTTLFTTPYCRVIQKRDHPNWQGRTVIIPRRHVSTQKDLPIHEAVDVHNCQNTIMRVYTKMFNAQHTSQLIPGKITKDYAGQETNNINYHHIHYHCIPNWDENYLEKVTAAELFALKIAFQKELIEQGLIDETGLKDTNPTNEIRELLKKRISSKKLPVWVLPSTVLLIIALIYFRTIAEELRGPL